MPTSTACRTRFSSQSISSSAKSATLRVAPELADPLDAVEVGEPEDVEEFGTSRWREGFEARPEPCLHIVESHAMHAGSPRRDQETLADAYDGLDGSSPGSRLPRG
jgi:hypothetical protein